MASPTNRGIGAGGNAEPKLDLQSRDSLLSPLLEEKRQRAALALESRSRVSRTPHLRQIFGTRIVSVSLLWTALEISGNFLPLPFVVSRLGRTERQVAKSFQFKDRINSVTCGAGNRALFGLSIHNA